MCSNQGIYHLVGDGFRVTQRISSSPSRSKAYLNTLRSTRSRYFSTGNILLKDNAYSNDGAPPWRDSASLILSAPSPGGKTTDLPNYLVMKRSKGSTFLPDTLCFPGGQLCEADSHPEWLNTFGVRSGAYLDKVKFLSDSAALPLIYGKRDLNLEGRRRVKDIFKVVPKAVSLRIAAIRETFEECGILICKHSETSNYGKGLGRDNPNGVGVTANSVVIEDPDELEEWQMKVKKDPMQFIALCQKYICLPDINALVEWSDWLTPNSFPQKRFDTIFYMAVLPHTLPYLIDEFEVASARWKTANDILNGAADGKTRLIPPQIYELTRLKNTNLDKIKQLMKMRLTLGLERWCPCYFKANDGILSVFPGDDLYPDDYRIDCFEEVRQLKSTIQELRSSTSSHHRIEFKSQNDFELVVNVQPKFGQIYLN